MKKSFTTFLILIACVSLSAQDKKVKFGFNFGGNNALFLVDAPENDTINVKQTLGFRVGIIAEIELNDQFYFMPKLEVASNPGTLYILNETKTFNINRFTSEFACHFTYKLKEGKNRLYFLAGPTVKLPFTTQTNFTDLKASTDISIDIGLGLDNELKSFNIAPEFRYSFGLMNIYASPNINSIYMHNISVLLNFYG